MADIQDENLVAAQKRGNVAVELIAGSVGGASQVLVGQVCCGVAGLNSIAHGVWYSLSIL